MAKQTFYIEFEGTEGLQRSFYKIDQTISDLTPIWKEVKDEFFEIEKDLFQSGGASGQSGKWADLSPASEAIKVAKYGTFALIAGPLIATERLYKSLTQETGDSIEQSNKQELILGTSVPYAKYHQTGARNLPARPPIDFTDKDRQKLIKRMKKALLPYVRKSGLTVDETNFTDV